MIKGNSWWKRNKNMYFFAIVRYFYNNRGSHVCKYFIKAKISNHHDQSRALTTNRQTNLCVVLMHNFVRKKSYSKFFFKKNLRDCWVQQKRNGNKATPNPYATNCCCHHKFRISSAERPHNGFVPVNFDIISLYLSFASSFFWTSHRFSITVKYKIRRD